MRRVSRLAPFPKLLYLTAVLHPVRTMKDPAKLTTIISTKGQVILPKAVRQQRHWEAGTRLVVEDTADGVLLKSAPTFAVTNPANVFRSLAYTGKTKSLHEMNAGIVAEARRRHAGNRY